MKRILTSAFVLVVALSMNANATNNRLLTMGENYDILVDDANIWNWPSRINMYPNLATGELGYNQYGDWNDGGSLAQFGINWKFGSDRPWVLGTYFYNDNDPFELSNYGFATMLPYRLPSPDITNWFTFPSDPLTSNSGTQRVSLFYGRMLGGNNFGFNLNYSGASSKEEPATPGGGSDEESFSQWDFKLGLTNAAATWDVAAGLSLLSWTDRPTDSTFYNDPDGNMSFFLAGRWFHTVNPQWTLVPHARFISYSFKANQFGGGSTSLGTQEFSGINFSGGAGLHYVPTTNVLAVLDFGFSYFTLKDKVAPVGGTATEDKLNVFTLPYFKMGLEADVWTWLDVRLGATSYWDNATFEASTNDKTKYNFPDNMTYVGLGFNFNRLHLDTHINPELFLNGFNFISGASTDNNYNEETMNFGISALYEMF
ncbi:MAG: hypothetical protein SGI97_07035 [candidate division Zixibacteria bacterium]|nr:hypothetical protein [candidate division Zixibacteria bacterium]